MIESIGFQSGALWLDSDSRDSWELWLPTAGARTKNYPRVSAQHVAAAVIVTGPLQLWVAPALWRLAISKHIELVPIKVPEVRRVKAISAYGSQAGSAFVRGTKSKGLGMEQVNVVS